MSTRTQTPVRRQKERQGQIMNESKGRVGSCQCFLGTGVNGPSSGAFLSPAAENPPGCRAAAEDPSAECAEGSVASSIHYNLLRSPSTASRSVVWKKAGVSTIRVGVLIPGTWYPHHPVLAVKELALHQKSKAMEPETKGHEHV